MQGVFVSKDLVGLLGGFNGYIYIPNLIDWINPLGLNKRLELGVHYVKDTADIALASSLMRNLFIIEKSLKILELTSNYSNYEVLNFLSCYQNLEIYINSFLDLMSEKLFNVSDKKKY
ncbi:hypothetical protein [Acinetobacter seifertii]|uniref:hypothetical protein n=1 Tax=Acinetobacter seifertii TaxID=1530123 RepID=UPI0027DDE868|nr:hypothetical protein [Acinetobacter seifertii]